MWEAFKAYSSGQYQLIIAGVRRKRREDLDRVEKEASEQEALYVNTRVPQHYARLQSLTQEALLRTKLMQKKLLNQSQRIFEQEERTGRLLSWLSREQSGLTTIAQIQASDGTLLSTPKDINQRFADYYQLLYSSRVSYDQNNLTSYLEKIDIPVLTPTSAKKLDAPIRLEEIQVALKMMQTGKTPGPDGFPVEFSKHVWKI